jgi:hypothetical protein
VNDFKAKLVEQKEAALKDGGSLPKCAVETCRNHPKRIEKG